VPAVVAVGVLVGLGVLVLGVSGGLALPGPPTGESQPGTQAAGTTDGPGEERVDDAASRSLRDEEPEPESTVVPLVVEPVVEPAVEEGSGLVGREVLPDLGGALVVVPAEVPAPGAGTVKRVRVEVEQGLPVDGEVFASAVLTTLNDARGWGAVDGVTFARTGGDADLRVVLASPATTDRLCAPLDTGGIWSCGTKGAAVLNFERWVEGAADFGDDMVSYRQYLVNHEVGHLLGHRHVRCPAPGAIAPVMVQQSMSTGGCAPNGWPAP
jgi:hypothetical protein